MSVLAEVQAHDAYFCSMLELIPAEMYFHKEETDERSWNKYMKAPSKTEKRKVKGALLRKKFDLEQRKTNAQRQVENATEYPKQARGNQAESDDDEAEVDDSDEESGAGDEDEEDDEEEQSQGAEEDDDDAESDGDNKGSKQASDKARLARAQKQAQKNERAEQEAKSRAAAAIASGAAFSTDVDTLRKKFKQRIAALRAQRQGLNQDGDGDVAARDGGDVGGNDNRVASGDGDDTEGGKKLPALGRAARKRKQREAKREQRLASKKLKKARKAAAVPDSSKRRAAGASAATATATAASASASASSSAMDEGKSQPESLQFSSLLIASPSAATVAKGKGGAGRPGKKGGKNLQQLLAKAELKKQRMQELAKAAAGPGGDAMAKTALSEAQWGDTMKLAQGETLLDDTKMLKKAIKRKEKSTEKSRKQWAQRKRNEKNAMQMAQNKKNAARPRTSGGRARAGEEAAKRAAKAERAGFEGRKGGKFLNSKTGGKSGGSGGNK